MGLGRSLRTVQLTCGQVSHSLTDGVCIPKLFSLLARYRHSLSFVLSLSGEVSSLVSLLKVQLSIGRSWCAGLGSPSLCDGSLYDSQPLKFCKLRL